MKMKSPARRRRSVVRMLVEEELSITSLNSKDLDVSDLICSIFRSFP